MKRLKQLNKHDPDNGFYGDCYRTAIACLLDKDSPDEVPHFIDKDNEDWEADTREYLKTQGYGFASFGFLSQEPMAESFQNVQSFMERVNPDILYIISGISVRGNPHVCIALNGNVIWDPHPDGDCVLTTPDDGFIWVYVLIPQICIIYTHGELES